MTLKSRFSTATEYFKNIVKASERSAAFVRKANGKRKETPPAYTAHVFVAPALDAQSWDALNIANSMYFFRCDGFRLHAVVLPLEEVQGEDVLTYDGQNSFHRAISHWAAQEGETVTIDAKFLREAIHPDAERVTLLVPSREKTPKEGRAVIVASGMADGPQIAWCAIAPMKDEDSTGIKTPRFVPLDDLLTKLEAERKKEERKAARQLAKLRKEEEPERDERDDRPVEPMDDLPLFREASRRPEPEMAA